jgi:hypothetical protein
MGNPLTSYVIHIMMVVCSVSFSLLSQISNEIKALADNAREIALARDQILFVPTIFVPRELPNLAISDLVTSLLHVSFSFSFFLLYVESYCCNNT